MAPTKPCQPTQKSKEVAFQCLDSKCKDKPPLSDSQLVEKWSLHQFDRNALGLIKTCEIR